MIHPPAIGRPTFDKSTLPSNFSVPSGLSRVAPQFWPQASSAEPVTCYVSPMGSPLVVRRRLGNQDGMSESSMRAAGADRGLLSNGWGTMATGMKERIPSQRVGFSPFATAIQSEFMRSYNRAIQTSCIISSFMYYYPAQEPQHSDEPLTDFWVDTSSSHPNDSPSSSTFKDVTSESSFPLHSIRKKLSIELTQDSNIQTTRGSRTSSLSPDRSISTVSRPCLLQISSEQFNSAIRDKRSGRRVRTDGSATVSVSNLRVARSETELLRRRGVDGVLTAGHHNPWLYWKSRTTPWTFWPILSRLQSSIPQTSQLLLLRPSRFDVLRAMWIDTATTTIQRLWRGYLGRRRAFAERIWKEWKGQATRHAIKIQRSVRRFLNRLQKEQEEIVQTVIRRRQRAAMSIQRYWKEKKRDRDEKLERIIALVRGARWEAAISIQRHYRGFKARKLVDLEHKRWLVTWRWDPAGKVVELVGSFTTPPWTSRILMSWDPMSKQYVVDLPRIPGRHEMKFVVDGDFCCDGSLTVISDGAGHYNNVVYMSPASSESPLKRLRDRLRLRNDPVFVAAARSSFPRRRSSSVREKSRHPSEVSTRRSNSTIGTTQPSIELDHRMKDLSDETVKTKHSPTGPGPPILDPLEQVSLPKLTQRVFFQRPNG